MNIDDALNGSKIFETARLIGRRWKRSDLETIVEVYSDPEVARYIDDGSPITREQSSAWLDVTVFCRDAGWRKPARPIFDHTLERLGVAPRDCLFVGDDPRWDLVGPRAAGIEAVLIDRHGRLEDRQEQPIRTLHELWSRLGSGPARR